MADLIVGGGEKVSIIDEKKSSTLNSKPGTITVNESSRVGSTSRMKMAERLADKLPKADTVLELERQMSAERKKIHVVKYAPKTDEEVLDVLISKHSELNTSMRRA